jgi:hypothetical protein
MRIDPRFIAVTIVACSVAALASGQVKAEEALPIAEGDVSIETLTKDGFEVKAIAQGGRQNGNGYVVMLQRGADIRTCLMRLTNDRRAPRRQTVCF